MKRELFGIIFLSCCLLGYTTPLIAQKGSAEFTTTNPRGRLLVRVQVWGDVRTPGVYTVPDTTSLTDIFGYIGGPEGNLEDVTIFVRRTMGGDGSYRREIAQFSGAEFLKSQEADQLILKNDDIVYVEAGLNFQEAMSVVGSTASVITSVAFAFFIFYDRSGSN